MFFKFVKLITLLTIFISSSVYAELAIIGHPHSDTGAVDAHSVKRLYTGERRAFPSGLHATPVNHAIGSPDRKVFFSLVMNMPEKSFKRQWKRKMSTGTASAPAVLGSHKEVLQYIANNPGTIGYIDSAEVNDTVKVLMTVKSFEGV